MIENIDKIAKVKYCSELIKEGESKRNAIKIAKCHNKTYNKYIKQVEKLTPEEILEVDAEIEKLKTKKTIKKDYSQSDVKTYKILITVKQPYYNKILEEAEELGCAPAIVARAHTYKSIRREHNIK